MTFNLSALGDSSGGNLTGTFCSDGAIMDALGVCGGPGGTSVDPSALPCVPVDASGIALTVPAPGQALCPRTGAGGTDPQPAWGTLALLLGAFVVLAAVSK